MKRLWVGVVFLGVLLVAGLGLTAVVSSIQEEISGQMSRAGEEVLAGDWEAAVSLAAAAKTKWDQHRRFVASVADHEPLEQMDTLFAELEIYRHQSIPADYAAVCTHISYLSRAIGESHALKWWNLL